MTGQPPPSLAWQSFAEFSADELYEMLRFRQAIFVVEQRSPYPDLDGRDRDREALHLLMREGDRLVGYLRLQTPADALAPIAIGRIAIGASHRGEGRGASLVDTALGLCRERYPRQPVRLHAQLHLTRFYERFGFAMVGAPFDDYGVPHVEMRKPRP